jgi:hypothetical protein
VERIRRLADEAKLRVVRKIAMANPWGKIAPSPGAFLP